MEEQGLNDVDQIVPTKPMTGGTSDNNYKGYILWTDGTKTDVQIKGSRSGERAPASFREALFYSRMADTLPSKVSVPGHYLGVADKDGTGLFITEFLNGAQAL